MKTAIFAHRGASGYAPENTMPAFQLAYELGAEGIETDVQLTKDGIPVLVHDEQVKRTTDGRGFIKNLTFEEVRRLDAGSWFSRKFTGTVIPSLEEFLEWAVDKPLYLNIELKNNKIDYSNLEAIVYDTVLRFGLQKHCTLSTFNEESVKKIKRIGNSISAALLTSRAEGNPVTKAAKLGADALHIKYRLLGSNVMMHADKQQMPVRVYTVNKKVHMLQCMKLKADGIFTDLPDKALEYKNTYYEEKDGCN
ncbi:glycerophosphodiester phosphodiesterase [Virgibacillus xinjiangensis]|uniref:Glycerophosphodiester phosphodiesterase n=1 Tax=Virgibacillus xinjiangensis TaxID=393090 RepID=A0ABV7CRL5_9BACI